MHDDSVGHQRRRACLKGAQVTNAIKGRKLSVDLPEDLTSIRAMMRVVEFCIRESISERLDPKVATVVAALVRVQAALVLDRDLEDRIISLEEAHSRKEHEPQLT